MPDDELKAPLDATSRMRRQMAMRDALEDAELLAVCVDRAIAAVCNPGLRAAREQSPGNDEGRPPRRNERPVK